MRLTLWTDYALRTLIFVGAKRGGLSTITEIAASFDISKAHLMKVVNRLGQQGYLDTVRGKGGGIRLARSPAEIRVGAIVRETEEDLAVMGCLAETGFCRIERCCVLRRALGEATLAFLRTLDGIHLSRSSGAECGTRRKLGTETRTGARGMNRIEAKPAA